MAAMESKVLTARDAAAIGEQAFLVASWLARDWGKDDEASEGEVQPLGELFRESLAQAFEALLLCRSERDGCGFLAQGHGAWVERVVSEIPVGWRPAYDTGRKVAV